MSLSAYEFSVGTFGPMLRALSAMLDKAIEHANAKGLAPDALVGARLAPDMFPLARQIQIATDHARRGVARLAGVEAPAIEDTEDSLPALKARVEATIAYLDGFSAADLDGGEARAVVIPGPGELEFHMTGAQTLRDWALPNFYFHLVTAYDILRHEGVELGKQDYLSRVGAYIRPRSTAA